MAELHTSATPHVVNSVSNAPPPLVTPHRGGAVQLKCFLPATRPPRTELADTSVWLRVLVEREDGRRQSRRKRGREKAECGGERE